MTVAARHNDLKRNRDQPVAHGVLHLNGSHSREDIESSTMNGVQVTRAPITPPSHSLSANVTPRSGPRRQRAEGPSPTPSPSASAGAKSPPPLSVETRGSNGSVFKSPLSGKPHRSVSVSSDDSTIALGPLSLHERSNTAMSAPISQNPSKFFYADEIPSSKTKYDDDFRPASTPWNGDHRTSSRKLPPNDVPLNNGTSLGRSHSPPQVEPKSKFFYASDIAEIKPPLPRGSLHSPPPRPALHTIHSGQSPQNYSTVRPPSPLKEVIFPDYPDDISAAEVRQDTASAPPDDSRTFSNRSRTSSHASSPPQTNVHARKSSVPSTQPRQRKSSIPQPINDMNDLVGSPVPTPSKRQSTEIHESKTPREQIRSPQTFSQPQSPTKPQKEIDRMNELAANARRDRKVLDLEISNSSLLAINSTLEREMRKMKSDLRHYRRLSRGGKLSSTAGSRLPRDSGCAPDEISSAESEDDDEVSSTISTSQRSSLGNRAALARFDDPKLEPLDLSGHHDMILQGRELNQTIKRCLGQSEIMLRAGQEALEFQAKPFNQESLGPRVLSPDEIEDGVIERRQGLLTPTVAADKQSINPWERSLANMYGGKTEPSKQPNPEALAKLNNTGASDNVQAKQTIDGLGISRSESPASSEHSIEEEASLEDVEEAVPPQASASITSSAHFDPHLPGNPSVAEDKALDSDADCQRIALQALTGSAKPIDKPPAKEPVDELPPEKQNGSIQDDEKGTNTMAQDKSATPPSSHTVEANAVTNGNTPANRGSITQYLSSLWATASSIRPT